MLKRQQLHQHRAPVQHQQLRQQQHRQHSTPADGLNVPAGKGTCHRCKALACGCGRFRRGGIARGALPARGGTGTLRANSGGSGREQCVFNESAQLRRQRRQQGLALVHISAQHEPCLSSKSTESTQRFPQTVLKYSRNLDECKSLYSGGRILLPPLQPALVPRPDVHLPPLPLQGAGSPNRRSLDGSNASTPLGSPRLGSTPLGSPNAKSAAASKSKQAAAAPAASASRALLLQGIQANAAPAAAANDDDDNDKADDNAVATAASTAAAFTSAAADVAVAAAAAAPASAAADGLSMRGANASATAAAAAAADIDADTAASAAAAASAAEEVNMDRADSAFFLQQDKARLEWLEAHGGSPGMGESTQWNEADGEDGGRGSGEGGGGGGGGDGGSGGGGGDEADERGGDGTETPPMDERDVEEHAAALGINPAAEPHLMWIAR